MKKMKGEKRKKRDQADLDREMKKKRENISIDPSLLNM